VLGHTDQALVRGALISNQSTKIKGAAAMAAMPLSLIDVQNLGQDLAQKTVCVKVRLGRIGNTRTVRNSQVEVDTGRY
jgi:hypothetical protein